MMKNTIITKTGERVPRAGLRLMRVRAEVTDSGQPGLGGATALTNGRLSDVSIAARRRLGMLECAMMRFKNRHAGRHEPAEVEQSTVAWIAGNLHLFAVSELEPP